MISKLKTAALCLAGAALLLLVFGLLYEKQGNRWQQEAAVTSGPLSKTAIKLNTVVTVTLYDSQDEELLCQALALCDQYEAIFSRTLKSSQLWKLNHRELPLKNDFQQLSPELSQLISKGLEYSRLSEGAFDITIEPISSLWDFTSAKKLVPSAAELQTALPLVDYTQVQLQDQGLRFLQEDMGIDLGSIAKGYIADRIKDFLVSRGVKSAIVNLGGNVLCIGEKAPDSPFVIGVRKPFADRSELAVSLEITGKSVVSSGIYERCFRQDGVFYHHLLNPSTGYPYDTSLVSVTIISDYSVDGDGLSTACFALGLEKGMELVDSLPGIQAIFITSDYELHYSRDFEKEITVLSKTDEKTCDS